MYLTTLLAAGLVLQLPHALASPYRRDVKCKYETNPEPGQACEISTAGPLDTVTPDGIKLGVLQTGIQRLELGQSYAPIFGKDEPASTETKTSKPTSADEPAYDKMPDTPSDVESVSIPNSDYKPSVKPTVPEKPSLTGDGFGNSIQTPEPIQKGMTGNCNKFHYVTPTTTCQAVLDHYKISLADFVKWNPAVGEDCTNMWAGTNACVSVKGYTSPLKRDIKPNPVVDNGVATPSPIQAGLVKNCVKFHYIGAGTTCHEVLHHCGITMAQFAQWNPAVGEDCKTLWKGTYACVAAV
ncbi:uncharacterized protein FTJAE_6916 [Fusarium tjaetaba]|uniref:LysM domain-containing protein n=1 Tax=Fusarium tjaetaba TaxID=1567544 RepID=A0A8H5RJ04_9HYPO|nr:uncharacterized protein FTJAE_6916 [Fusarium tjaetaba]KAF5633930.1 hypothetical protein FTJAE_6916 [Fusarium tjaetaba]